MKKNAFYLVTESNPAKGRTNEDIVREAIKGGVDIVQLREKDWPEPKYREEARKLLALCRAHGVLFVVNDHAQVARDIGADGLHIGQDDLSLADARRIVGPDIKIGVSTHSTQQAIDAQRGGADYIGIGPIYPTTRKPNLVGTRLIRDIAPHVTIPIVAIGGIKLRNARHVLNAGASTLAVISAVTNADNVQEATRAFVTKIHEHAQR